MHRLLYHPRSLKFFKKLPTGQRRSVFRKIGKLKRDPFSAKGLDIKKLATTKGTYRLRAGSIRVIYEVDIKRKTIYIHDIDFRGNIY